MEKAKEPEITSRELPPSAGPPSTARDVLRPLSQTSSFPSSGSIVAAMHEQKQSAPGNAVNDRPSESSGSSQSPTDAATSETTGSSVQKRSEVVQQMRDVDDEGVRTWRRLIVEYS